MADERATAAYPEGSGSRRVVHGTLTYGLASVLQRAAPLLLLPLFAQILSPEEFGQIGIILTLTAALATVAALGLETAVFRGYRQAAGEARGPAAFVNSLGWFGILAPWAVAAVALILLGPVVVAGFELPPIPVVLGAVTAACTASATIVPLAILRAQERLRAYLALTSAQVVISAGLSVFLIVVMDLGVVGWMLASALAGVVVLTRGVLAVGVPLTRHVDRSLVLAALAFGLPLVPHALAHWGLAVSDRAILGAFLDQAVVGVYYVAFLFSLPVSLVAIAISQATQPLFASANSAPDQQSTLGRVVSVQSAVVILVGAAAALIGPPASRLILPPDYEEAARFIPLLSLGTTLFGLYLAPMNAISLIAGRTSRVWIITVAAAALNIGLNLVLVPRIGAMAAAMNTVIGYAALLIGVFAYQRSVCDPPLRYEWTRLAYATGVVMLACLGGLAIGLEQPGLALIVRATLLAAAALLLALGPLRDEARTMLGVLRPEAGRVRQ